eukprot:1029674_1
MQSTQHIRVLHFVVFLSLLMSIGAVEINCEGNTNVNNNTCTSANLTCPTNGDCTINCKTQFSCSYMKMQCPMNGDCNINCLAHWSCFNIIINATDQIGNFNLLCHDSQSLITNPNQNSYSEMCQGMEVYGSTKQNNMQYFNVSCIAEEKRDMCWYGHVYCAEHMDCFISCKGKNACAGLSVYGPIDHQLKTECDGFQADDYSCDDITLHGEASSKLVIDCLPYHEACHRMNIWCPPNSESVKNCFLSGDHADIEGYSAKWSREAIKLYALYGWDDVDLSLTGTWSSNNQGTMYCGLHYAQSCHIVDGWTCLNSTDYCNDNVSFTYMPTIHPTIDPTIEPTMNTKIPTVGPTFNPTIDPTMEPTVDPTADPTIDRKEAAVLIYNTTIEDSSRESDKETKNQDLFTIVVVVASILAVFAIIAGVCFYCKKKRKERLKVVENMKDENANDIEMNTNTTDIVPSPVVVVAETVLVTPSSAPHEHAIHVNSDKKRNDDTESEEDSDSDDLYNVGEPVGNDVTSTEGDNVGEDGDNVGEDGDDDDDNDGEYEHIKRILQACDAADWNRYLENFQRQKMTDSRLKYIKNENDALWDKLIPEWGVKLEFIDIMMAETYGNGKEHRNTSD